jgi:hypothetical protein
MKEKIDFDYEIEKLKHYKNNVHLLNKDEFIEWKYRIVEYLDGNMKARFATLKFYEIFDEESTFSIF